MKKRLIVALVLSIIFIVIISLVVFERLSFVSNEEQKEKMLTYTNDDLNFRIDYPSDWTYYEKPSKQVTTSWQILNESTRKYDNKFIKGMSDFKAYFGPENISYYVVIEVFNGSMEDLFNRTLTRQDYTLRQIRDGKTTLDKVRDEFYGEEISLNSLKAYRTIEIGMILTDPPTDHEVLVTRIENNVKVISLILHNSENSKEVKQKYFDMLSSFEFSKGECTVAGQSPDEYFFGIYDGPVPDCCEGLDRIQIWAIDKGICIIPDDAGTICSDCGNGNCEEWENKCSCPEDCTTAID